MINYLSMSSSHKVLIEQFIVDNSLLEFTISDFVQIAKTRLSNLTKRTFLDRNRIQGDASQNTKLLNIEINKRVGSITYEFLTEATEEDKKLEVNPKTNKKVRSHKIQPETEEKKVVINKVNRPNPSHTYNLKLRFLNILPTANSEGLLVSHMKEKDIKVVSNKIIIEVLNSAEVQIDSNDPSFLWQGFKYWLTKKNASIEAESIYPRVWVKKHGRNAFLTKHLAQVFIRISWFINQAASSLNNQIKVLGYKKIIDDLLSTEPDPTNPPRNNKNKSKNIDKNLNNKDTKNNLNKDSNIRKEPEPEPDLSEEDLDMPEEKDSEEDFEEEE